MVLTVIILISTMFVKNAETGLTKIKV
jgi:hypothetical protein